MFDEESVGVGSEESGTDGTFPDLRTKQQRGRAVWHQSSICYGAGLPFEQPADVRLTVPDPQGNQVSPAAGRCAWRGARQSDRGATPLRQDIRATLKPPTCSATVPFPIVDRARRCCSARRRWTISTARPRQLGQRARDLTRHSGALSTSENGRAGRNRIAPAKHGLKTTDARSNTQHNARGCVSKFAPAPGRFVELRLNARGST